MGNNKITTVCIPTCDRPESLNASLSSLIENLNKYKHIPRILIADDSENTESTIKSRNVVLSLAKDYVGKIEFIDRNDRLEIAKKLAIAKNLPEELTIFALCGDKRSFTTAGSVRNTFFIKTKGEKILIADDDVIYNFIAPKVEGSSFFTIENPLDYWFLVDKISTPNDFGNSEFDIISEYEKILGKKVMDVLNNKTPELVKNCDILDTYIGCVGSSPMKSHIPLLTQPQVYNELESINQEQYNSIKSTPDIIQISLSSIVYQGPMCFSMAFGVDNRILTPPFIPIGRAQDLVFGTTRWKAFPLHLSLYLSQAIRHKRPQMEVTGVDYDVIREMTKINRIISSLIEETNISSIDPRENLKTIGEKIISIAEQPEPLFKLFMDEQCKKNARYLSDFYDYLIKSNSRMPSFWTTDIQSMKDRLSSPDTKLFLSDISRNESGNKIGMLRHWIFLYGQLLINWQKMSE